MSGTAKLTDAPCAKCGAAHSYFHLDSKPEPTRWLRFLRLVFGQRWMLSYAARHGYDFDRLECSRCYGPGYLGLFLEPRP